MAKKSYKKKKEDTEEIKVELAEVNEIESEVKPKVETKSKVKIKHYPLKRRLKVSGKWREVGETIGVTDNGYQYYKSKKII